MAAKANVWKGMKWTGICVFVRDGRRRMGAPPNVCVIKRRWIKGREIKKKDKKTERNEKEKERKK